MTALQLANAVLEGEDPKSFLRRVAPTLKIMPKPDQVSYDLDVEWDPDGPAGFFGDPRDVEWVREQIEQGNVWGWGIAHVTARYEPDEGEEVTGEDYLSGCSYEDEAAFKQSGYYDDMRQSAYNELCAKLRKLGYR